MKEILELIILLHFFHERCGECRLAAALIALTAGYRLQAQTHHARAGEQKKGACHVANHEQCNRQKVKKKKIEKCTKID